MRCKYTSSTASSTTRTKKKTSKPHDDSISKHPHPAPGPQKHDSPSTRRTDTTCNRRRTAARETPTAWGQGQAGLASSVRHAPPPAPAGWRFEDAEGCGVDLLGSRLLREGGMTQAWRPRGTVQGVARHGSNVIPPVQCCWALPPLLYHWQHYYGGP